VSFKFNPISGNLDLITDLPDSVLFKYGLGWLSAYDTVCSITNIDAGLKTQIISQVVYSSALYPDRDVTKTVSYHDVGSINQRIDKIEYTGGAFTPQTFTKEFYYTASGLRYLLTGIGYNLI